MAKIMTLDLGPVTVISGTGNHPPRYVAWIGRQRATGLRGWGQTAREAEHDLEKQIAQEKDNSNA